MNAERVRHADIRFTTYRLQIVEQMAPGPWKDALLRAIRHRLVALGLPSQVHAVVRIELDCRLAGSQRLITSVSPGMATVTATLGSVSGSTQVTITAAVLT